jgi:hypothetical protein
MAIYRGKHPKKKRPRPDYGPRHPKGAHATVDRTNGVNVTAGYRYYATRNSGQITVTGFNTSVSRTEGFVGVSLPRYKSLIKSVLPATTPMTANTFILKSKALASRFIRSPKAPTNNPDALREGYYIGAYDSTYGLSSTPSTPPAFSGAAYDTAYNSAVSRLYSELRLFESRSNVGEDLGEISQTVNLLRKPLAGIQDLMRYAVTNHSSLLKRAKWNNTKQIAKGLGSVVTEYQFGIKPLIATCAEAFVSLQNRDRIFYYYPFEVYGKGETFVAAVPSHGGVGAVEYWVEKTDRSKFKVKFKGVWSAESPVDKYTLNQSLGLTWAEFIPTLYNLIPYSFLLDYVVNLNQFVETLAVPWGGVRWCNMTERSEKEVLINYPRPYANPLSDFICASFTPGFIRTSVVGVRRSDHSNSMPFPNLQVKRPSVGHLANTAALLAANLPVIGRLTRKLLGDSQTKSLDRHFSDINRDYKLRVPYPKFTF